MVIGYTFRVGYIYRADCKATVDRYCFYHPAAVSKTSSKFYNSGHSVFLYFLQFYIDNCTLLLVLPFTHSLSFLYSLFSKKISAFFSSSLSSAPSPPPPKKKKKAPTPWVGEGIFPQTNPIYILSYFRIYMTVPVPLPKFRVVKSRVRIRYYNLFVLYRKSL